MLYIASIINKKQIIMKKVLLFAIVIGSMVAFTSCSKSECECTVSGQTVNYGEISSDECDDFESVLKFSDPSASCSLK